MRANPANAATAAAAKTPQQLINPTLGSSNDTRSPQVWNTMQLHQRHRDPILNTRDNPHNRRSSSAPSGGSRDCQRGADKFCHTVQPSNHNYLGLQPNEKPPIRQTPPIDSTQWPTLQRCSNCCGKAATNNNSNNNESQRLETSYQMNNSSGIGMNYGDWQRQQQMQQRQVQQQQQQLQQQQQFQQQQQQRQLQMRSMRRDEFNDFEPALNSTMMEPHYQGNAGRRLQRSMYCQPHQQQQQLQQLPQQQLQQQQLQQQLQQQQLQQQSSPYRTQAQQQAYRACCMPQQPTSVPSQATQQRMQYPDMSCQIQHDLSDTYNETSYMQLPQGAQKMQQQQSTTQQVTFREPSQASSGYRTGTIYQSNPSMNQTSPEQSPNLTSKKSPSCQDSATEAKSVRSLTPLSQMKHEDLIVHRAETLFFESLVLDSNCPGVIQSSLSGKDNFNDHAFQIAFGDQVPNEPKPVDPITMLEAIKLRIDHERAEIHKKCRVERVESELDLRQRKHKDNRHEEHSKRSARSDSESYYYKDKNAKKKRRGQQEITPQELLSEDIDRHFRCKHKSDVNDGIYAFLKAENDYSSSAGHASKNFSANVNSHESHFLGLPIKMRIYNATTWPID
ncbi:putative mediator of RNA polymerase II transcription subunit 26 isoform X1 [Drosophila sulfurigaster albostrigata]|uniref:putative mediator of RNA polymerase II transcription subunit 26 isoform X1 n=1 Tax=Drosophila sulfurigaster albostrigata TaxID=89887 RepID=UPI002D21D38B|nr:putative mediator of RNA polymerase II transcription subunit 26 isoform X1 [Drosophila sulfurigaster albostrigata]